MLGWGTAAKLAFQGAARGYEHRHVIQKFWKRSLARLNLGATEVLVTGHSGAGKSTLAFQMHGRARAISFEVPDESLHVEVEAITLGEWTKLVRILPGQEGRRTVGEIEAFQNNPDLEGVIHVVDYGFVSPRDPVHAETLIKIDGIDTIEKLRKQNLQQEVVDLKMLLSNLRRSFTENQRPKWLVIAVNKFDLFPELELEALQFYHPDGTGAFGRELKRFQSEVGANKFGIYVIPTCAYEQDFTWNGSTVETKLKAHKHEELLRDFIGEFARITEIHE